MAKKKGTRGTIVTLTSRDHKKLTGLLRDLQVSAKQAKIGLIIEMLADGWSEADVSRSLRARIATVGRVRRRYLEEDLEAAFYGYVAPGRKKKITPAEESRIVAIACSDPPTERVCWSAELIVAEAQKSGAVKNIGRESVRLILKQDGMKPWQRKMWCVPKIGAEYRERMGYVLDTYEKPYNPRQPVICRHEKPTQLLSSYRPSERCLNGSLREKYEYKRCGTASIVCCVEPKAGRHTIRPRSQRCSSDFADFMLTVSKRYRHAQRVHLIMDNLKTHRLVSLVRRFGENKGPALWDRFKVSYTPKYASWLNQAVI